MHGGQEGAGVGLGASGHAFVLGLKVRSMSFSSGL